MLVAMYRRLDEEWLTQINRESLFESQELNLNFFGMT